MAPTSARATPQRGERYAELDGHRGIAALAIVVFHIYQFSNINHFLYFGTLGYTLLNSLDAMVPWFFVITAFLLFKPIARLAIAGEGPVSARGFLSRRAIRILPAYYVAVAVVWFLRQDRLPGDWRDLLEHLTFTQVFDEKRIFYTIGPAWSLSVEVYFYLLLAVLAIGLGHLCRRLTSRKKRVAILAASVGVLGAAALLWKAWSFSIGERPTTGSYTTWFGPIANLDGFAIGMAVAVAAGALGETRPLGPRTRSALRLAALTLLIVAFATRQPDAWSGPYFSTLCSVGFGCLIAAAVLGAPRGRRRRVLTVRPIRWLGQISYSLYLWHEPVLLTLLGLGLIRQLPGSFLPNVAVVVAVSVVVGWLSYSLIERPTSQLGQIFRRDTRLVRSPAALHIHSAGQ